MPYSSHAQVCGHLVEFKVLANEVYIKVDGAFRRSQEPDQKVRTRIALKALGMWKAFLKQAPTGYYYCTPAREELRTLYLKAGWEPVYGDKKRLQYLHVGNDLEEGEDTSSESQRTAPVVPVSVLQEVELVERQFQQELQDNRDSVRRIEENLERLRQEREVILAQLELLRREREALSARLAEELESQKK